MKKSNIILTGLLSIILIAIIIFQFKYKSFLSSYKITKIDLAIGSFNNLQINNGWYVEFHKDSVIKVTVNSDSLKDLISLNNNKLTLNKTNKDFDHKLKIQISAPNVAQISLFGNSTLYYYAGHIDSLNVNLSDFSNLVIKSEKINDDRTKSISKINFLTVNAANQSRTNIYGDIDNLFGELKDSSYCYLPGAVNLKDFKKSNHARLNW